MRDGTFKGGRGGRLHQTGRRQEGRGVMCRRCEYPGSPLGTHTHKTKPKIFHTGDNKYLDVCGGQKRTKKQKWRERNIYETKTKKNAHTRVCVTVFRCFSPFKWKATFLWEDQFELICHERLPKTNRFNRFMPK